MLRKKKAITILEENPKERGGGPKNVYMYK
jgi:hypothetical protein